MDEAAIRAALRNDFPKFAENCLRIRTKEAGLQPLVLNREQLYVHEKAQDQLRRTGRVRIILLKGRQQGMSTYVEGRFYWRVSHSFGVRSFILTHHAEATSNLFNMAKRYYENCPPILRPEVGASSQKELVFPKLDSGYKVGTAGTEGIGRSDTIQFFHGSEVAFWPNADEHAAGALQAVPQAANTEVWLESTANGVGNFYHRFWQQAEAGQSDYEPVFIPWYWNTGYNRPVADPDEFMSRLDEADLDYMTTWGLTVEQMAWRAYKTVELNGDEYLFMQEYPACPSEAFQVSGPDSFIKPVPVMVARKAVEPEPYGGRVLGVDPARFGEDRTSIYWRQGRVARHVESLVKKDTMEVVGHILRIWQEMPVDKTFIDVGGLGAGIVDRLRELGHGSKIMAINFGETANDPQKYVNKRAEMWGEMRDWLNDGPVSIPDRDTLHSDLVGPKYSYDSKTRLKLETKEEMKKRGLRSPDEGDGLALTFAYPVHSDDQEVKDRYARRRRKGGGWQGA